MKMYENQIIPEADLVEAYGTAKQVMSYREKGKFVSSQKQSILKKAARNGKLRNNGDQTYTVLKAYDTPYPKNWEKMSSTLYQYIIPLILQKLINIEESPLIITTGKWAREIHMVNRNYEYIKKNVSIAEEYLSDTTNISNKEILDFYDRTDTYINYYISKALNYIKDTGCIKWNVGYRVIELDLSHREATVDDKEFEARCIEIADKAANIVGKPQLRFKNEEWNTKYFSEMAKGNMKLIYPVFEIYTIHKDICKKLLQIYTKSYSGRMTTKDLTNGLTTEFIELMKKNAGLRYESNVYLQTIYNFAKEYQLIYEVLGIMTVSNTTRFIEDVVAEKKEQEEKMDKKFKKKNKIRYI